MEIHLKINDVVGMDDEKRHILRVDDESLSRAIQEHEGWMTQNVVREWLMKRPHLMSEIVDDPQLRNVIYMQEKARREQKAEKREHRRQFEIERQRRKESHQASIATRKAMDFYRDILGIDDNEEEL